MSSKCHHDHDNDYRHRHRRRRRLTYNVTTIVVATTNTSTSASASSNAQSQLWLNGGLVLFIILTTWTTACVMIAARGVGYFQSLLCAFSLFSLCKSIRSGHWDD